MLAPARRRALVLGYVNGVLWAIGNGLTTGTLVYYLAQELGARGTALSVLIAAPSLVGLLRLATPALITRLGGIKATCLKAMAVSYLLLAIGLPTITLAPPVARRWTLAAMIALICVHQLLEYIGSVALWSWLSVLVPAPIRGRYFGRRQLWQLAFLIPALYCSGRFTDHWKQAHAQDDPAQVLVGYVIPTSVGTVFLLASLVPLLLMPDVPAPPRGVGQRVRPAILPDMDRSFRRLLVYRAWFSFFNGITQAAQNVYVYTLRIPVTHMQMMQLGMRAGQMVLSPAVGRASDRFGNRPVLELSQAIVAMGPLFFILATREHPWWVAGAYVVWTAYAGLNVCLTNIMLKLAPPRDNSAHIAWFEALGGVAFGLSAIAGGMLLDALRTREFSLAVGALTLDHFAVLFLAGAVARAAGVFWLARIAEPGAIGWREILRRRRNA